MNFFQNFVEISFYYHVRLFSQSNKNVDCIDIQTVKSCSVKFAVLGVAGNMAVTLLIVDGDHEAKRQGHSVEKQEIYSHLQKIRESILKCSSLGNKIIDFTQFLRKNGESEFHTKSEIYSHLKNNSRN